jgi:hypothetical protein
MTSEENTVKFVSYWQFSPLQWRLGSSVSVVSRLRSGRTAVRFLAVTGTFFLILGLDWLWVTTPTSQPVHTGGCLRRDKCLHSDEWYNSLHTTHLWLLTVLRTMTLFYFTFTRFNVDGSQICDSGTNFQYVVMFIILWHRDAVYAGTFCPIFVGEVQYTILFPKRTQC